MDNQTNILGNSQLSSEQRFRSTDSIGRSVSSYERRRKDQLSDLLNQQIEILYTQSIDERNSNNYQMDEETSEILVQKEIANEIQSLSHYLKKSNQFKKHPANSMDIFHKIQHESDDSFKVFQDQLKRHKCQSFQESLQLSQSCTCFQNPHKLQKCLIGFCSETCVKYKNDLLSSISHQSPWNITSFIDNGQQMWAESILPLKKNLIKQKHTRDIHSRQKEQKQPLIKSQTFKSMKSNDNSLSSTEISKVSRSKKGLELSQNIKCTCRNCKCGTHSCYCRKWGKFCNEDCNCNIFQCQNYHPDSKKFFPEQSRGNQIDLQSCESFDSMSENHISGHLSSISSSSLSSNMQFQSFQNSLFK